MSDRGATRVDAVGWEDFGDAVGGHPHRPLTLVEQVVVERAE
jgi:hypothetical protein